MGKLGRQCQMLHARLDESGWMKSFEKLTEDVTLLLEHFLHKKTRRTYVMFDLLTKYVLAHTCILSQL